MDAVMRIDARGHRCPYPVVLLGRAASEAGAGTRIELLSDDPVSVNDVPAWCRMRGATLESVQQDEDHWAFVVVTGHPGSRPVR